jgi:integrase
LKYNKGTQFKHTYHMGTTSITAKVKLRDNKFVVIHYRTKLFATGIAIESPEEFSNGKLTSRFKGREDYRMLNTVIQDKLQMINSLITDSIRKGLDPLEYISVHFKREQKKLTKLKITINTPLHIAYQDYVELKVKKLKDINTERSLDRYQSEVSRLKDFNDSNPTTLGDLEDSKWYYDFVRYLSQPHKKTYTITDKKNRREFTQTKILKQTNSTIARFCQDLITFLKTIENSVDIKFPTQEIADLMNSLKQPIDNPENVIAMTKLQWEALKKFKPFTRWEHEVFDLYRFCTYTGLRYSDAIRMNAIYLRDGHINMTAEKTRNQFSVLVNPEALEILKKYDYDFRDKFPSSQRININLRNVLKQIPEFCVPTIEYDYVLQKVNETVVEAFNIFSFHSSRRSFVSFALQNGATNIQVMKFTGWRDQRTLNSYTKIFGETQNNDEQMLNF